MPEGGSGIWIRSPRHCCRHFSEQLPRPRQEAFLDSLPEPLRLFPRLRGSGVSHCGSMPGRPDSRCLELGAQHTTTRAHTDTLARKASCRITLATVINLNLLFHWQSNHIFTYTNSKSFNTSKHISNALKIGEQEFALKGKHNNENEQKLLPFIYFSQQMRLQQESSNNKTIFKI